MTRKDAVRVARFHATNLGCSVYPSGWSQYSPQTWRAHFESDLRAMKTAKRVPDVGEVERIETFLAEPR